MADPHARAALGLGSVYAYWEQNEALIANVLRDGETDAVLNEVNEYRFGGALIAMRELLVEAWPGGVQTPLFTAMAALALDFRTWQTLVRRAGLTRRDAAELTARTLSRTAAADAAVDSAA